MLHHRLAFEGQNASVALAEVAYSIDQVPRIGTPLVAAMMVILDLFGCITVCLAIGHGSRLPSTGLPLAWLVMPIMLWLACAYATALYDQPALRRGGLQMLPALATTCLAFLPSLGGGGFAGAGGTTPSPAFMAFLGQMVIVVFIRAIWAVVQGALLRRGFCLERVVVLSSSLSAARLLSAALEHRTQGRLRAAVSATTPRHGDETALSWLENVIRVQSIDRILLTEHNAGSQQLHDAVFALGPNRAEITVIPQNGRAYRLDGLLSDLPRLDEHAPPLSPTQLFCKRAFDICVSVAALLGLVPLLLLLSMLIRLDSKGPVLFRQTRQGLDGKLFKILKFRTMHTHMSDLDCTVQTTRGDKRVTRIGRLLRSTSLDELPQLVNVLLGDMSVIGPRPHALGMRVDGKPVTSAVEGYESRLRMKPGITGWAQVNGSRGEVRATKALRQRVALDCHYIENWSVRTDAKILCRTVALIFRDQYAF